MPDHTGRGSSPGMRSLFSGYPGKEGLGRFCGTIIQRGVLGVLPSSDPFLVLARFIL